MSNLNFTMNRALDLLPSSVAAAANAAASAVASAIPAPAPGPAPLATSQSVLTLLDSYVRDGCGRGGSQSASAERTREVVEALDRVGKHFLLFEDLEN